MPVVIEKLRWKMLSKSNTLFESSFFSRESPRFWAFWVAVLPLPRSGVMSGPQSQTR